MHAAIGSSGSRQRDAVAGDLRERRFDGILNAAAARLRLPAEKAAAVVLQS
jgi:hypothetical protein